MYKVLFVCTGATCRSPMASCLFNHKLKNMNLSGAKSTFCGINVEYGSNILQKSKNALKTLGIQRICGTPMQINGNHLAENNLIVCLTDDHKEALEVMIAEKYLNKLVSFKEFAGENILDPYGLGEQGYISCAKQIDKALDNLISVLYQEGIVKQKKERKCSKK